MSQIESLVQKLCPEGVEFKSLGSVGQFIRGSSMLKSDLRHEGFPAIHYGQVHTVYGTSAEASVSFVTQEFASRLRKAKPGDLVIATTSEDDEAVAKAVAWVGTNEVAVSGDAYIFRHSLEPKYVSYFFQSDQFQAQKASRITGAKVRRISGDGLAKIIIPVPPIEVQKEIVKILDTFSKLEAELEARRKQYTFYRDQLLTFTERERRIRWATMTEICTRISSGATPLTTRSTYYEGGVIPWLRTQEVVWRDIHDTEMNITEKAVRETAAKWIPKDCVIVAISGATAGRAGVNKIPLTTNQHCCNMQVDPKQASFRYVFHWVTANYEKLKALGRGARSDLNVGLIKSFPIAIPDLREQDRIVALLDKFDALVNDLSIGLPAELTARRQQYEYYRDRLLSFKEAV